MNEHAKGIVGTTGELHGRSSEAATIARGLDTHKYALYIPKYTPSPNEVPHV